MEVTAESDDFLLRSSHYTTFKQMLQPKLSIQGNTFMLMAASVKQLQKKLSSVVIEKRRLEMTIRKPMRKYSKHNTVVGKSVEKLENRVANHFLGMAMCISKANPKCY